MPLLLSALSTGLPGAAGADYPETLEAAAAAWAGAVEAWAAGIVPPSSTVSVARAALEPSLVAAFGSESALDLLEQALAAFALTVAGGMAASGFVGAPPPGPVGFASLFTSAAETRQAGVNAVAAAIDAWGRTGLATPPAGPPVAWA